MAKRDLDYRIKNITSAVMAQPWLCHERKLEEIKAFLEFRASGGELDEATIRESFAAASLAVDAFVDAEGNRVDVDGIRYVPVMGVLAPRMNLMQAISGGQSTQQTIKAVSQAGDDESVKTIFLHIDSPGGVSTLVPELSDLIFATRKKKRVVAFAEGMMASAALWVGTAAKEVYASPSTDVGSQGAYSIIMTNVKQSEMFGETYHVIRAGEFKAMGIKHEELSEVGRKEIQRSIDELDEMFIEALARNRNVSEEFVRDRFGRGKVFSAKDATERKLIDGVTVFDELLDRERKRNAGATTVSVNGGNRFMKITPRVKAAMFAQGCIDAIDAADEICVAYIRGCAARDDTSYEDADEAALISLVLGKKKETTTGIDHKGNEYEAEVLTTNTETPSQVRAEMSARTANIRLAAKELGVPDSMVVAALASDPSEKTVDDIREEFARYAEDQGGAMGIAVTESAVDKVAKAMVGAIFTRCGKRSKATKEELQLSNSFSDSPMLEMARETLRIAGVKTTGERAKDARAFLALGIPGPGQQNAVTLKYSSEPSYNRLGDHPDALSNIMGRILDDAYDEAPQTYTVYTKQAPDVPDERPKTFVENAVFQELDAIGEDEKHNQLAFQSANKAWLQVAKYGNKVGLTESMIINDDLMIFSDQLSSLQTAAVNTVDNSCRTMLTSNPTLIDGTAMFTLAKGNYVDTGNGAAPSETSASEHRKLHMLIKGYGSTRTINRPPDKGIFPAALVQSAMKTFMRPEPKSADSDTNVSTVVGMVTPTFDGMLDGYTNGATRWWTFVSGIEPIVIAYLLGMGGATGRRTTWTDPDTGTRYVAVDMWAGFAPLNWRGAVLNEGV